MSLAGASLGAAAIPETDLSDVRSRTLDTLHRINAVIASIQNLGDRAYGEVPNAESKGASNVRPVRAGVVGQIKDNLDCVSEALDALNAAIIRIENLA